jgi:hypothetical protein
MHRHLKKFGGIKNYQTEFFVKKDQIRAAKAKRQNEKKRQAQEEATRRLEGLYQLNRTRLSG